MILRLCLVLSLSLIAFNSHAQILSAPISISEEGTTQKAGEDPEVAKARSELEASKVKPSQKDDSKSEEVVESAPAAPVATPTPAPKSTTDEVLGVSDDQSPDGSLGKKKDVVEVEEKNNEPSKWRRINFFAARRWFRLNVGRVWSQWSDISSELKDGSLLTGFRVIQPLEDTGFSVGLGIDFLYGSGDSFNAESIRSTHIVLETEYEKKLHEHFAFVPGLSLEYADSNIRKVVANNGNEVTYRKFSAGSTFGVVPAIGMRALPSDNFSVDLIPGYAFYFASPESKMGGLSLRLRFNLAL